MARPFTGGIFECLFCKIKFKRAQSEVARGRTKYCSPVCSGYAHRGENSPCWGKGWFIDQSGYKKIRVNGVYVREHRHIMEQHLGYKLSPMKDVHHINQNKLDNRIENLEVMSKSAHTHAHGRRGEKNNKAKLEADDIKYIRAKNAEGVSQSVLAKRFNVDPTNISCIILRKTWKHI